MPILVALSPSKGAMDDELLSLKKGVQLFKKLNK
jgi:hypothetical protein